jgi:hypothetical protein
MHSSIIYEVAEILSIWSTHTRNDMPNKLIPEKLEFIKTGDTPGFLRMVTCI